MYRREIVYDRETRDYAMYLDGELVSFARTYHEAEIKLDAIVYDLLDSLVCWARQASPPDSFAAVEKRMGL